MAARAKPAAPAPKQDAPWRNRIVGEGDEAPDQLLAHPKNWRIHPRAQQEALAGVLSEVGWVQRVLVNRNTSHVLDGHARVALAISRDEPSVPVLYVDLSEEEEDKILATLDPIAAMAAADKANLGTLLEGVAPKDEHLRAFFADLAIRHGTDFTRFLDQPGAGQPTAPSQDQDGRPLPAPAAAPNADGSPAATGPTGYLDNGYGRYAAGEDPYAHERVEASPYLALSWSVDAEQRRSIIRALRGAQRRLELGTTLDALLAVCAYYEKAHADEPVEADVADEADGDPPDPAQIDGLGGEVTVESGEGSDR